MRGQKMLKLKRSKAKKTESEAPMVEPNAPVEEKEDLLLNEEKTEMDGTAAASEEISAQPIEATEAEEKSNTEETAEENAENG